MPVLVQKNVKSKLEKFAEKSKELSELEAERENDLAPAQTRFDNAVVKVDKIYGERLEILRNEVQGLSTDITTDMQNGYDAKTNEYSPRIIETDEAMVEVNSSKKRTISSEAWLKAIPQAKQNADFYETLNVLIGKSEKFDSATVSKVANESVSHSITVRLKQ